MIINGLEMQILLQNTIISPSLKIQKSLPAKKKFEFNIEYADSKGERKDRCSILIYSIKLKFLLQNPPPFPFFLLFPD